MNLEALLVIVSLLKKAARVGLCKMKEEIKIHLRESCEIINLMIEDEKLINVINLTVQKIINSLKKGNKVITAGNGGSASDSQHFVGELVSRFNFDRPGLNAISLNTNTTNLTAIANDYGYENLFKRQLEAIGKKGDVFIAYSTSGMSSNILAALKVAKNNLDIFTIGMGGSRDSIMKNICDYYIEIPSSETPKIQEGHAIVGHIICCLIEKEMFENIN